jgi:hypothetical protein
MYNKVTVTGGCVEVVLNKIQSESGALGISFSGKPIHLFTFDNTHMYRYLIGIKI